jgi:hypothetical protein
MVAPKRPSCQANYQGRRHCKSGGLMRGAEALEVIDQRHRRRAWRREGMRLAVDHYLVDHAVPIVAQSRQPARSRETLDAH